MSPGEAVHLLRTLVAAQVGTLLREVSAGPTFGLTDVDGIRRRQATLEESGLPDVASAASDLAHFDRDAEFEYTVDLLVAAARARIDGRRG
ncbi:hypothetical protein [Gordonia insulae]|uniref:Tetracycline repressor TetR C-terminal domain-containing protein n=1 Tax=Gordonia insulae TaxID=2420509 RepID=A0A3G8JNJ4_9ACTN|nr:hypothetical protein [Gordonia insulae]AZG46029.1 hypothetical protein D7316_02629 [Gordonia insulae]